MLVSIKTEKMRLNPLTCIVILFIVFTAHATAQPYRAVLYNGSGATVYDRITAMTLAGIVNRDSARLYLLNVFETWSYSKTDETWRDIYKQHGNVQFDSINTISELINRFRPFIKGAVTYDLYRYYSNFSGQNFNYQAEVAAVIGSLTDRLPVSAAQAASYNLTLADSVLVNDTFDGDSARYVTTRIDLPSQNWNNSTLSEESRYLLLIDYGIRNLLPLCNPSKFYIREITDFTVQQKMFQVNFAGTDDLNLFSMPENKADRLEQLLNYYHAKNPDRIFHMFGWIRPEPMTQWFAQFGSSFHETLLNNLSWHSSFPTSTVSFVLPAAVNPDTAVVRNNFYLIFIGTEGDASNWNFAFQSGAWVSPQRGSVAVGWGWNLYLLNLCPFVAKYYYETATVNDGFISAISPLGYAYPDLWNDDVRAQAVWESKALMEKFGVKTIYAYKHYAGSGTMTYRGKIINNSFNFPRLGAFQRDISASLTFLFDPQLPTQTPNTSYGSLLFNHVGDGTFYGDASNLQTMANSIAALLNNKPKPYFLLAGYQRFREDNFTGRSDPSSVDITMPRLKQLADLLKANTNVGNDIQIITPQYFSVLLRKKLGLPISVENENSPTVHSFEMYQNYPNPFNPSTIIRYQIPNDGIVNLQVFDVLGNEIATPVSEWKKAGSYEIHFNGNNMPSGIYFYRLECGNYSAVKKLILIR